MSISYSYPATPAPKKGLRRVAMAAVVVIVVATVGLLVWLNTRPSGQVIDESAAGYTLVLPDDWSTKTVGFTSTTGAPGFDLRYSDVEVEGHQARIATSHGTQMVTYDEALDIDSGSGCQMGDIDKKDVNWNGIPAVLGRTSLTCPPGVTTGAILDATGHGFIGVVVAKDNPRLGATWSADSPELDKAAMKVVMKGMKPIR